MLSRRAALQGGTEVATCAAVTTAAGAVAAVVRNDADPVVDLGRQWTAIQEKIARLDGDYDERRAKLPEWAKLSCRSAAVPFRRKLSASLRIALKGRSLG